MKSICVFCGSNTGFSPTYVGAAQELGRLLVKQQIRLIYGGGNIGLMGAIADEMLHHGGEVIGVIPDFLLQKEVGHRNVTELIVVESMHERKQKMADLSDGFIAMPGGFGTMDELCEILTWAQLGLHSSPIGILNTAGYFDALLHLFDHFQVEGFLKQENRNLLLEAAHPAELLGQMASYEPPQVTKWIDRDQT